MFMINPYAEAWTIGWMNKNQEIFIMYLQQDTWSIFSSIYMGFRMDDCGSISVRASGQRMLEFPDIYTLLNPEAWELFKQISYHLNSVESAWGRLEQVYQ